MSHPLRIALAQINPIVGDIKGNQALILAARQRAGDCDLLLLPELALSGYPPEDLVLKDAFLAAIKQSIEQLTEATRDNGAALLVGAPIEEDGRRFNAVFLLEGGDVKAIIHKVHLPNYGVFDEVRVFAPGTDIKATEFRGHRLGIMICEDMWFADIARGLRADGAEILLVPNGSPFEADKPHVRRDHAASRVAETGLPLIYLNQIGGQDELVFDGASFCLDRQGRLVAQLASWREDLAITEWRSEGGALVGRDPVSERAAEPLQHLYQAMMLGLRDYVRKNRFPGILIGLSGGIDSALALAVAVDALGAENCHAVMMPSPFTSADSLEDAALVAGLLGVRLDTISIEPAMAAFGQMLASAFTGRAADITEENLQSRSRGLTLMALSNKFGKMLLSTGNKSEMSVGYTTLYGDMCGGYAVLKDVYKTTVFALSRWRNQQHPEGGLGPTGAVMPERVITKPPSAELKPDQTDQDSLPPYDLLDAILTRLIEQEMGPAEIIDEGFPAATVRRVFRMLDRAEYKRRQAPPGVKITSRAFGRDRRYPITNGFTDNAS